MNVLLADDDMLVLEGMDRMLPWGELDAQIIGKAASGEEALRMARANRPDVVITDICMPGMDGLELVEALRREMDDVEILLLSGYDDFAYAQRAMSSGVRRYYLKPISRETIAQITRELAAIRDRLAARRAQYARLFSAGEEQFLLDALARGDVQALEDCFTRMSAETRGAGENAVTTCLWLLGVLYRHLASLNVDADTLERSRRDQLDELLALGKGEEKLFFIQQKFFDLAQEGQTNLRDSSRRIALQAKALLDERFMEPDFNVSALADELGKSTSYISMSFKRLENVNISTYLTELRLNHARELLTSTAMPINELAQISGYIDAQYFGKLFKKKFRMTPTEYRNCSAQKRGRL